MGPWMRCGSGVVNTVASKPAEGAISATRLLEDLPDLGTHSAAPTHHAKAPCCPCTKAQSLAPGRVLWRACTDGFQRPP